MIAPACPREASTLLLVISAASLIPIINHASEVRITNAVIVQTTKVSINVPVMLTNACFTGSFVLAEAAAIAAEPNPDSFENKPLETPNLIAAARVAPTNPPAAAVPLNALEKLD